VIFLKLNEIVPFASTAVHVHKDCLCNYTHITNV